MPTFPFPFFTRSTQLLTREIARPPDTCAPLAGAIKRIARSSSEVSPPRGRCFSYYVCSRLFLGARQVPSRGCNAKGGVTSNPVFSDTRCGLRATRKLVSIVFGTGSRFSSVRKESFPSHTSSAAHRECLLSISSISSAAPGTAFRLRNMEKWIPPLTVGFTVDRDRPRLVTEMD